MESVSTTNNTIPFLYHYTSFDTLALILSNRTICFNSLLNVDDIEEAKTDDMGNFGRFIYASCWTNDSNEDIALWGLYTPNMHGVRIGLPRFPFKKFFYKKGDLNFDKDIETFINMEKVYRDNVGSIVPNSLKLIEVQYTTDEKLLFPVVKRTSDYNLAEKYLNGEKVANLGLKRLEISYEYGDLGKYKHTDWRFQKEWRYILPIMPIGMQEYKNSSIEKHQMLIQRINNLYIKAPYDRFFLDLDDGAIKQMEIVLGPRMSESEKIYVKSLLKDHGLENNWRESKLRIR